MRQSSLLPRMFSQVQHDIVEGQHCQIAMFLQIFAVVGQLSEQGKALNAQQLIALPEIQDIVLPDIIGDPEERRMQYPASSATPLHHGKEAQSTMTGPRTAKRHRKPATKSDLASTRTHIFTATRNVQFSFQHTATSEVLVVDGIENTSQTLHSYQGICRQ
jgi:hypothetical protein